MRIEILVSQNHPDITLYKLHGELVLSRDAEQLVEDVQSRMHKHPQRVMIFDFSNLFYVNSLGIGILLKIRQLLADQEAGLVVTNMQQHIYSVFSDMGLFRFIFKFDNLYEAFKNYGIGSDEFKPCQDQPSGTLSATQHPSAESSSA